MRRGRHGPAKRGATNDVPTVAPVEAKHAETRAEEWYRLHQHDVRAQAQAQASIAQAQQLPPAGDPFATRPQRRPYVAAAQAAPRRGRGAIALGRGGAPAFFGGRGAYGGPVGRGAAAAGHGGAAGYDRSVPGGIYSLMGEGRDRTSAAGAAAPAPRATSPRREDPPAQRRERVEGGGRAELYEQGSGMADTLLLDFFAWTCAPHRALARLASAFGRGLGQGIP